MATRALAHAMKGGLICLGVLALFGDAKAQNQKAPEAKKHMKVIRDLFKDLEIVDLQVPPAEMTNKEIFLPAFRLHNKTKADLNIPDDISPQYTGSSHGLLGIPMWKFTPLDGNAQRSPVFIKGNTVRGVTKIEADGVLDIGAKNQITMVATDGRLAPGNYKVSAEFRPWLVGRVSDPESTWPILVSTKSHKVVIKESPDTRLADRASAINKKSAAAPPQKSGANLSKYEELRKNDIANLGKSALMDAVTLTRVEFDRDTISAGAPLACSLTVDVTKGFDLPDEIPGKPSIILYNWGFYRILVGDKKEYVFSGYGKLGRDQWDELKTKRTCTFNFQVPLETKLLVAGSYELSIFFNEQGVKTLPGSKHTKTAVFKITK